MSIYVLPASMALLVSIVVFFAALQGRKKTESNTFCIMVFMFICLSVCEVLSAFEFFKTERFIYLVKAYYLVALCGLCSIFAYSLHVARKKSNTRVLLVYTVSFCLSCLVLFTDIVIEGIEPLGHTQTAIRGELYILFQVFSVALLILIIGTLTRGYMSHKDHMMQIRCSYTLLALLPLVFTCLLILVIMAMGYKVNAVLFMPIVHVAFILITLVGESEHQITDIRRFMPYSVERHTSNEIMDIFSSFARDEISYRDGINEIERLLVLHKYQKNGGNASATAELMKMPRSSLYSIFHRLGIETDSKTKD